MSETIDLECPECDTAESAHIGPTISLGAEFHVVIDAVNCANCGYEGPPDPD